MHGSRKKDKEKTGEKRIKMDVLEGQKRKGNHTDIDFKVYSG